MCPFKCTQVVYKMCIQSSHDMCILLMVLLVDLASISLQFDNCDGFRKEFGGLLKN